MEQLNPLITNVGNQGRESRAQKEINSQSNRVSGVLGRNRDTERAGSNGLTRI